MDTAVPIKLCALVCLFLASMPEWLRAQDVKVCAVLPIEALEGVEQSVADQASDNLAAMIKLTGKYNVLPMGSVRDKLVRGKFRSASYKSPVEGALAAGNVLQVDFVLVGHVATSGAGYELVAGLADVRGRAMVKTGKTKSPVPDTGIFLSRATKSMVDFLVGYPPEATSVAVPKKSVPMPVVKESASATQPEPAKSTHTPIPVAGARKSSAIAVKGQEVSRETPLSDAAPIGEFFSGHLRLGTRATSYILMKSEKNYFLGSINKLSEDQNYSPIKVHADWLFNSYIGVELTWDEVTAVTATENKETNPSHHDGDFFISGPILTVFGRYPNRTCVTPYGGIGIGFMGGSFKYADWWRLGYSSEAEWAAAGSSSSQSNGGYIRNMEIDDSVAGIIVVGCESRIAGSAKVDLMVRYMDVDVDAHYYLNRSGDIDDRGITSIPMSNLAIGLGVLYSF